jgi:hypothetical protein
MLFNDLNDDDFLLLYLINKEQPLKQLKLDDILLYFLKQEELEDQEEEEEEEITIDDDLNIINLILKDFYLNELKNKKMNNYWNQQEDNIDKDKCISEFEGNFGYYLILIDFY